MKTVKVNDIEIRYDDSTSEENLSKIRNIISKYYNIFDKPLIISLSPTSDEGVFYIDDVDEWFKEFMSQIINDYKPILEANDEYKQNCLELILFEYYNREASRTEERYLKFNTNFPCGVSDEHLWIIITAIYYYEKLGENDWINHCIDYLLLTSAKETEEIFMWLISKVGLTVYNELLKVFQEKLLEAGYPNNIAEIAFEQYEKAYKIIRESHFKDGVPDVPQNLSNVDIDKLFIEFLKWINAPQSWYDNYYAKKKAGLILIKIYNSNDLHMDNSRAIIKIEKMNSQDEIIDNSQTSIIAEGQNIIDAFITLVHEFMHSIAANALDDKIASIFSNFITSITAEDEINKYEREISDVLASIEFHSEYPSVFFEGVAADFLVANYGISNIDDYLSFRQFGLLNNYINLFQTICDLAWIRKFGPLQRNHELSSISHLNQVENSMLDNVLKMGYEGKTYIIIKEPNQESITEKSNSKLLDATICGQINRFNKTLKTLSGSMPYCFATYLSDILLSRLDTDPTIIERMIKVTNELPNLTLQDIIDEFDLHELFEQTPNNSRRKQHS